MMTKKVFIKFIVFILLIFIFTACSTGSRIERYYSSSVNKPEEAIKLFIEAVIQEFPDSLREDGFPKSGIVKYVAEDTNANAMVAKCFNGEFYNPNAVLFDNNCHFMQFEFVDYPNARYFFREIFLVSEKEIEDLEDMNKSSTLPRIAIHLPYLGNGGFINLDSMMNNAFLKAGVKKHSFIYSSE